MLKNLILPLIFAMVATPAKCTVQVLPAIQFVREGGSVLLKARASDPTAHPEWKWQVLDPDHGVLQAHSPGRVRFTASGAAAWDRVVIRATRMDHPDEYSDALVEILPNAIFRTVEQVLGKDWISENAMQPSPIELTMSPPSLFSWSEEYLFHAEIHSAEIDLFVWEITPGSTKAMALDRTLSTRETVSYFPPPSRTRTLAVHVRVANVENRDLRFERTFYIGPNEFPPSSAPVPVPYLHRYFGAHMLPR